VPIGVFQTQNGWVALGAGVDDVGWSRLATAMGRPDLADKRHAWRHANQDEVYRLIEEWVATFPDSATLEAYLMERDVLVGRVRKVPEALEDPQLHARGMIEHVDDDPYLASYNATNSPWRFREAQSGRRGHPPALGQHARQILTGVLGYPVATVDSLIASGAVGEPTVPPAR
jgi:crotonobetainyl-CoA:carnitine CoA-transferase CaiB-like acyl-CoA transferase